ncbi:hypothetical protein IWQ49_006743 [Labrenzia sp. EL_126]|nr:hypothetical protein [Labrenzia sp. EL_126]
MAVKRLQMFAHVGKVDEPINRTKQMVIWHVLIQGKLVKECALKLLPRCEFRGGCSSGLKA